VRRFQIRPSRLSTIKPLYINDIITVSGDHWFIVDRYLTWMDHVAAISKNAKDAGALLRIRHCIPKHILF